jgi:Flp pilus assembly protein TadG
MKRAHSRYLKTRKLEHSRGAVMVEFALMLPLLVLILLVIFDLGWILRERQILENAAREGAHFAALQTNRVDPNNPDPIIIAQIKQRVIDYCSQENITVQASSITVDSAAPIPVGTLTERGSQVTVTYQRQFLIPGIGLLPSGQMTLVGQAVFLNFW